MNNSNLTDTFSWNRVGMLARYFAPSVKKQMMIYVILTIVIYAICQLSRLAFEVPMFPYSLSNMVLAFMIYVGALVYARYDDVAITTLIPARGDEKAIFILGYVLVVIPVVVVGIFTLCGVIMIPFTDNPVWLPDLFTTVEIPKELPDVLGGFLSPRYVIYTNFCQMLFVTSLTLYVVISARRNRVIKGILAVIITTVVISFIGGIFGAGIVIYSGFKDGLDSLAEHASNPDEIVGHVIDSMFPAIYWFGMALATISLIAAAVLIRLSWRKVSRRQV